MGLDSETDHVASPVDRYLLPHERQVLIVRMHPACLLVPGLTLPALVAAAVKLAQRSDRPDVVWCASGLLGADCVRRIAGWPITYFVLTSRRLLIVRGAFTRTVTSVPLDKVESLEFHRSLAGRLLGWGTLSARSGGRAILPPVRYLPYPEQIYLEVSNLLHPAPASDPTDRDGERADR